MEKSIQEGQGVPLKDESSSRSRLEDDKPSLVTAQIELSEDSSTKKDKDDEVEDYEPAIQFSPLIPLPPLVDVGKIHEMEDIIFKARGKIYCFDPYGKHWNERGIGDIKILQDKEVKSKVRVVMWRENVNTVACNHLVKTVNAIREQNMSKNTIIWSALDFAFEYPHEEIFACKFTTLEDCSQFKCEMEHFLSLLPPLDPSSEPVTSLLKPLAKLFKTTGEEWTCSSFSIQNPTGTSACEGCDEGTQSTKEES